MGSLEAVKTIEITNERDKVVLRGEFSAPTLADEVASRVAMFADPDRSAATGSATLERDSNERGATRDTLRLEVRGLQFPSLYRVLIDQSEIGVFSTSTSADARIYFTRRVGDDDTVIPD
jgi:hypothetical protein